MSVEAWRDTVAVLLGLAAVAGAAVARHHWPTHVVLILCVLAAVWSLLADWLYPDHWNNCGPAHWFHSWDGFLFRNAEVRSGRTNVSIMMHRCSISLYIAALGYYICNR